MLGFANHTEVTETMNTNTFYLYPCTSQNEGTVESSIGKIRSFFPKTNELSIL